MDKNGLVIKSSDIKNLPIKDLKKIESIIEKTLVTHYGEGIWNTLESLQLIEQAIIIKKKGLTLNRESVLSKS